MENYNKIEQTENKNPHKNKVHKILAHSYLFYFILFLISVYFDLLFKFKIFTNFIMMPVGVTVLIFGSILIMWAQKTSRNLKKENINIETFLQGPYRYTRSPTHFGLFLLMLGFGIIANAVFVILFTIIFFIVAKFVFLDKQEKILAEKYGIPYLEYKKIVRF